MIYNFFLHPSKSEGLTLGLGCSNIQLTKRIGVSFNGRTADSGSADWGSNPCTPAQKRGFAPLSFFMIFQKCHAIPRCEMAQMHFASTFDARESCSEEEGPTRLSYNESN